MVLMVKTAWAPPAFFDQLAQDVLGQRQAEGGVHADKAHLAVLSIRPVPTRRHLVTAARGKPFSVRWQ